MVTDYIARGHKPAFARMPPAVYGAALVIAAGLALWALAPDQGSRGETLARLVQWAPALAHGFFINVLISVGAISIGTGIGLAMGSLALQEVLRAPGSCHFAMPPGSC
jgi:polar amino acid transport system permease protein